MTLARAIPATPIVDETLVRGIPKAEVHVHLEGCFELADLLELAKAAGARLPGPAATLFDVDTHDVPAGAPSALSAFLRFLDWEGGLVRTPEQAARAAYRFAARESASGVRYADVIINPTHWGAWRNQLDALFGAFAAGLDEAEQDGLCVVNLCASLLRQQSPAEAAELVDWIVEARPPRLVALSIDGDERAAGRTGPRFAEAFGRAARAGLRRTVHAGESSGPEGVWDALDLLGAERIDHGIRAAEDPALLARLADSQVPLGVCPRSNLALGLYPDRASHPLPALRAAGVAVTINTDDPAAMGYRLESEWVACADAYGWGLPELAELARASITASFAPPELQTALIADVDRFVASAA